MYIYIAYLISQQASAIASRNLVK